MKCSKIRMALLITALLDLTIAGVLCVAWGLDKIARKTLAYAKRLSELNKGKGEVR
ncbi:hypothetical protein ES703_30298 [subsurface metagenome]